MCRALRRLLAAVRKGFFRMVEFLSGCVGEVTWRHYSVRRVLVSFRGRFTVKERWWGFVGEDAWQGGTRPGNAEQRPATGLWNVGELVRQEPAIGDKDWGGRSGKERQG